MTSVRTSSRLATAVTGAFLLIALAGCSSSSSAETAPAASSVAASTASAADAEPSAEPSEAAPSAAAAAGTAVLVDGEAPAERTITITAADLAPNALSIAVGDTVTFTSGDDSVYAVEVGGLDSATVSGGLIETFQFPEAGEYAVTEIITGATALITVQ